MVALLRGGAWIEICDRQDRRSNGHVALLRGGAWIEILTRNEQVVMTDVALLRGGAWIEIIGVVAAYIRSDSRTPSRGCVD